MLIKFLAVILLSGTSFLIQTIVTGPTGFAADPLSAASTSNTPELKISPRNDSAVKALGTFIKVKSDGEHANGYSITLWKQNDEIIGLVAVHRGLIGDPPAGLLENVKFDPQTKKLSFTAKLTLGQFYDNDQKDVPSQDILEFGGTLTNKKLAGTVTLTDQLCANGCAETKKIDLPRSKEFNNWTEDFQTHAAWKGYIDEILKRRGPRW